MLMMTEDLGLDVDENDISTSEEDDDRMDRDTFFQFAGPRLIQKERATRAFHCFDTHGKGVVVREDVELIAVKLGESLDAEEVEEMMEMIDSSSTSGGGGGEGLLTLSDFVRLAKQVGL
jgi:Ca2+-binding EF-hand superfamily protein